MSQTIHFYRVNQPYGFFSNFSAHPVELDGKRWPTSEHYFQAQKFLDEAQQEAIRAAARPGDAARMGRERTRPLREDWEQVKDDVMRRAVRAKFAQHPDLCQELLDTGDAHLVEHTANDRYWADGGDGTGRNMLGRILMEVREELRRR